MSEPARAEMHAHPDSPKLIRKNIDVMISATHRAELIARHIFQSGQGRDLPRFIVEQFVIDAPFRFLTDTKRDLTHDIIHDRFDLWRDLLPLRVGSYGKI